jgi:WD40 repeat protein
MAPPATPGVPAPAETAVVVSGHAGGVRALCATRDGKLVISGGLDETLRLWDADRLHEVRSIAGDVGPVEDVAVAPDGTWAASCALRLMRQDMVVQLWDLATLTERCRLRGPANTVHCVAIAPQGHRVAAGCADGRVHLWDPEVPGKPALSIRAHAGPVSGVAFLPGGGALLSGGHDGVVRLWDATTGAARGVVKAHIGKVKAVAYGRYGKQIAIAGDGLRLRQPSGALSVLAGHRGAVLCLAFSPYGRRLLSGGSDGTVRLWRSADGVELACLQGHVGGVRSVSFSADGRVALSGGTDGTLRRRPLPD